jgi:hypothetical protein
MSSASNIETKAFFGHILVRIRISFIHTQGFAAGATASGGLPDGCCGG